jgi:hypothetical protein
MRFLSVKVVVGYVLVGRVVRPRHAGAFNDFFGTSITALGTQLPLCGSKAAQHWRKEAFEDSGFYPTGRYGNGDLLWLKQSRINPYLHGAAEQVSSRECHVYCGVYEPQPGFLWFSRGGYRLTKARSYRSMPGEVLFGPLIICKPVRWGLPRRPNPRLSSSSPPVASACSATAGGASSAQHSVFPSPVHQERTAT